jgi:hypothetical protein
VAIINQANTISGEYQTLINGDIAISSQFMKLHQLNVNDQLYAYASLDDEPSIYIIRFIFDDFLFILSDYYQSIIPYQGAVLFGGDDVPNVPIERIDYLYFGQIQDNFSSNTFLVVKSDLIKDINYVRNQIVGGWAIFYSVYFLFACWLNLRYFNALDSLRSLKRIRSKVTFLYVLLEAISVVWFSIVTTTMIKVLTKHALMDFFIVCNLVMILAYVVSISLLLANEFKNRGIK